MYAKRGHGGDSIAGPYRATPKPAFAGRIPPPAAAERLYHQPQIYLLLAFPVEMRLYAKAISIYVDLSWMMLFGLS